MVAEMAGDERSSRALQPETAESSRSWLPLRLGTPELRRRNRKLVFDLVTVEGPVTRTAVADALQMSASAVGDIVAELVTLGLIRESGVAESGGGRRPILIDAHAEETCLLGLEIRTDYVKGLVSDPAGAVLASVTRPCPAAAGPRQVVEACIAAGSAALERAEAAGRSRRLLAVGLACAGVVRDDGVVTLPDVPGWNEQTVDAAALVRHAFDAPLLVENDANLGALAELRFGAGRGLHSLIYVLVHAGVGSGVIIDGVLFRGSQNGAGEIGHTVVDPNGLRCECGNYGCLETLVSANALSAYCAENVRFGMPGGDLPVWPTPDQVVDAALAGERAAVCAVERVGNNLGLGFGNLINLFNPQAIVLAGPIARTGAMVIDPLSAVARQRALAPLRDGVRILPALLDGDGSVLGACAAALEAVVDELAAA